MSPLDSYQSYSSHSRTPKLMEYEMFFLLVLLLLLLLLLLSLLLLLLLLLLFYKITESFSNYTWRSWLIKLAPSSPMQLYPKSSPITKVLLLNVLYNMDASWTRKKEHYYKISHHINDWLFAEFTVLKSGDSPMNF